MPGPYGQDLRRKFHLPATMNKHGAGRSTGEYAMQVQVLNPDESWYGPKSPEGSGRYELAGNSCLHSHSIVKTGVPDSPTVPGTRRELIRNYVVDWFEIGVR